MAFETTKHYLPSSGLFADREYFFIPYGENLYYQILINPNGALEHIILRDRSEDTSHGSFYETSCSNVKLNFIVE